MHADDSPTLTPQVPDTPVRACRPTANTCEGPAGQHLPPASHPCWSCSSRWWRRHRCCCCCRCRPGKRGSRGGAGQPNRPPRFQSASLTRVSCPWLLHHFPSHHPHSSVSSPRRISHPPGAFHLPLPQSTRCAPERYKNCVSASTIAFGAPHLRKPWPRRAHPLENAKQITLGPFYSPG